MSRFKESYWYNTALCLPIGLWYSYLKEYFEKVITKNNITYLLIFALTAALFCASYRHSGNIIAYEVKIACFVAIILLITMKINICNKALIWLGNHVFSIYILQRVPMLIFRETKVHFSSINLCFAVCFGITLIISLLFDILMNTADKKLFKAKQQNPLNENQLIEAK